MHKYALQYRKALWAVKIIGGNEQPDRWETLKIKFRYQYL